MKDSLNDIRLTPGMLADLFGQSLVAPIDNTRVKKTGPEPRIDIKFLGSNNRHIMVAVSDDRHTFLPETDLAFLTKMLDACKLNVGDVAIVNMATQPGTLEGIAEELGAEKLLCFGVVPGKTSFERETVSGRQIVYAPALGEMNKDTPDAKQLKTKLWVSLKQLFGL